MSVLAPLSHALAALIAATHAGVTALGADPAAGSTWVLCVAAVVAAVRIALLPLVVHGVRQAHAAAHARPQMQALAQRYRTRKDADSVRAFLEERRRISAEHHVSRWGCLPMLVQVPIWMAVYHLVGQVAAGVSVGAMNAGLVASLGAATVVGVPLAERGYLGGGWSHLVVVAALAGIAALLSYVTQKFLIAPNTVLGDVPPAMTRVQQLMPAVSAIGLVVAASAVPVALLVYWACNSAWTFGQSAVLWRWFATPGSPAALRGRSAP